MAVEAVAARPPPNGPSAHAPVEKQVGFWVLIALSTPETRLERGGTISLCCRTERLAIANPTNKTPYLHKQAFRFLEMGDVEVTQAQTVRGCETDGSWNWLTGWAVRFWKSLKKEISVDVDNKAAVAN